MNEEYMKCCRNSMLQKHVAQANKLLRTNPPDRIRTRLQAEIEQIKRELARRKEAKIPK